MIQFNELRVTQEGSALIIDAQVRNMVGYENTFIDQIIIDSEATFVGSGPSSKPIYKNESIRGQKSFRITLDRTSIPTININDTVFFVYVITHQEPAQTLPEGESNTTLGVAVNLYPFYQSSIYYSRELINSCTIPKCFIELILRIKAFNINIETGHYTEAITLWNKYLKGKANTINNNCHCNGPTP